MKVKDGFHRKPVLQQRIRKMLLFVAKLIGVTFLLLSIIVFVTGDGGVVQHFINGIEQRALQNKSTIYDKYFLRMLYRSMIITGAGGFPEASYALEQYIHNNRDSIWLQSDYLTRHPDILEAVKQHKKGVLFGKTNKKLKQFYYPEKVDPRMYYLFHLLHIRYLPGGDLILHDWYYFQKLSTPSYTTYPLGKVRFRLRDGLIHVAYPNAPRSGFVICCLLKKN